MLRSGQVSNEYFDKYRFESDPRLLAEIRRHMKALVPADTTKLAGLEMGGIPLATVLSLETGLLRPVCTERSKSPTARGNSQKAANIAGERLLIVEDVITSGGQVVASGKALEGLGATIVGVLCVIDRESGGRDNIKAAGWEMFSLFTKSELESARPSPV